MNGIIARILGFRIIEKTDRVVVMKMPFWSSEKFIDLAIKNVKADYEVRYPGKCISVKRGHKLIRIETK